MIKNFSVNVQMEERWVPFFCSFLKNLEHNSNIGQSYVVGFYADGDGAFTLVKSFIINSVDYADSSDVIIILFLC